MIKYPQAPTGSIADTQILRVLITYASASLGFLISSINGENAAPAVNADT